MKENTCCFSGHRIFPKNDLAIIKKRLDKEIDNLIQKGVTNYISGGAIGFDQIAASLVISKKQLGAKISLVFALPCRNQDKKWTKSQKHLYQFLLKKADKIIYVSEEYTPNCMKERNIFMVDNSSYCICALTKNFSGTGQTIRYAKKQNLQIINVV